MIPGGPFHNTHLARRRRGAKRHASVRSTQDPLVRAEVRMCESDPDVYRIHCPYIHHSQYRLHTVAGISVLECFYDFF